MNEIKTQSYYTTDLKVKRPKMVVADAPISLPNNKLFSPDEADSKIQAINFDIYNGAKKEKKKHDFDKKLFFKIFTGVTLATLAIVFCKKIKNIFRKS